MEVIYKKLTSRDIDAAMEMNTTFRDEFLSRESTLHFLQNPDNWLFVAISDSKIIGFAYGYALDRLDTPNKMLYINEVGIAGGYKQQGIGTNLMTALKQDAKASGIHKIFLYTDQENRGANALYQKTGGEVSYDSKGNDTVYFFRL